MAAALHAGYSIDQLYDLTKIDRWFLNKFKNIVTMQRKLETLKVSGYKWICLTMMKVFLTHLCYADTGVFSADICENDVRNVGAMKDWVLLSLKSLK